MKHWQLRGVIRDPETNQILGYGKPRTMPPGVGRMWIKKHPNEWEVLSTSFEVPDPYVGAAATGGPMSGVAEMTDAGKALAAKLRPKADDVLDVAWKVEQMHAPVSVADARGRK